MLNISWAGAIEMLVYHRRCLHSCLPNLHLRISNWQAWLYVSHEPQQGKTFSVFFLQILKTQLLEDIILIYCC